VERWWWKKSPSARNLSDEGVAGGEGNPKTGAVLSTVIDISRYIDI
jgi:hypothetical protein